MSNERADHNHICIRIDEKLAHFSHTPSKQNIFKVHDRLRRENEKAYEPELVAIGPYHHGKDNLKAMENHKLWYLQLLLERRHESSIDRYIMAMRELEERARKCYAESISLIKDEFVEMMLLDGCFIMELFRKFKMTELIGKNDPIFELEHIRYGLRRDLMLLENQVPFFVLAKLFNMTKLADPRDNIIDMALEFLKYVVPGRSLETSDKIHIDETKHLLSLVHDSWCLPFAEMMSQRNGGNNKKQQWELINSTTELREAGVRFKKVETKSLFDIKFVNGVMNIPPFRVGDRTESLLRNLIAYEQYLPDMQPKYVSDYVTLMHCLINSSNDVEHLRRCGIIQNWLGNDVVVHSMLSKLGNNINISANFCYSEVFNGVNKHCERRWNLWMAKLRRNYFNSPWAFLSFVAALVLLLLTVTQTVYSVLAYN